MKNTGSPSTKTSKKRKTLATIDTSEEIRTAVKGVMNMMNNKNKNKPVVESEVHRNLQHTYSTDLYILIYRHKNHLKFLKENEICTEQEHYDIIQSVKDIYAIISNGGVIGSNIVTDNSNNNVS